MTQDFGFTVAHGITWEAAEPVPIPDTWRVVLPHQCDEWEISGSKVDPVSQEQAITDLERFIAEAQAALESLRAGRTHGDQDRWGV